MFCVVEMSNSNNELINEFSLNMKNKIAQLLQSAKSCCFVDIEDAVFK